MNLGTKKSSLGTKNGASKQEKATENDQTLVKQQSKKAEKGTVSLQKLGTTTRFKYRYAGKVYFLTVPTKSGIPLTIINAIKKGIESDILFECHDDSQLKYKMWLQHQRMNNITQQLPADRVVKNEKAFNKPTEVPVENSQPPIDKLMTEFMNASGRNDSINLYHYTYRMIVNWLKEGKEVHWKTLPRLLNEMNYASETYNNRRYVLSVFCKWLVKRKGVEYNVFEDVVARKKSNAKDPRRQRLTDQEVKDILEAIRQDTFLKANNRGYKHSHYYPIFCFLAYSGCRPAEAIGLTLENIDFNRNVVTIDSAFARTRKGTSYACRIMKTTKTNTSRELPFVKGGILDTVLRSAAKGKCSQDFVFHGPNSKTCDDRAMNDSILKVVCDGLNIHQRILYCFRHSFCSRCFEQGMDLKSIQSLTGHKDLGILLNVYAEVNRGKVRLPDLV